MPADTYRSLEPVTAERFEALLDRHQRESPQAAAVRAILARRVARVVAGVVASLLGASAMLGALVLRGTENPFESRHLTPAGLTTCMLVAAWPSALAAGLVARALVLLRTAHALREPSMPPPALALTEITRLERARPLLTLRRRAARAEGWSAAAPLAGLSLTAPLTLHLLVSLVFTRSLNFDDFDGWIALSALLVGPAHLVLVCMAMRWGLALRGRETEALHKSIHGAWMKALLLTAAAGAVPCFLVIACRGGGDLSSVLAAFLSLVPAMIVTTTGLAFVPAMYLWAARRIRRERELG